MPTYEYSCPTCGTVEAEQRISEAALSACPQCGAPVKRLISRSSFALKGGGWYSEGYASNKGPQKSEAASGGCGAAACGTGGCAGAKDLN